MRFRYEFLLKTQKKYAFKSYYIYRHKKTERFKFHNAFMNALQKYYLMPKSRALYDSWKKGEVVCLEHISFLNNNLELTVDTSLVGKRESLDLNQLDFLKYRGYFMVASKTDVKVRREFECYRDWDSLVIFNFINSVLNDN